MSAKTGKRPMRSRSVHEKLIAIHRVRNGETKASVARSMDVPESTLRGWCKNEDKIRYLSQFSSFGTDGSPEAYSHHKKRKLNDSSMHPLNMNSRNNSGSSRNPHECYDAAKTEQDQTGTPSNLHVRMDATPKPSSRSKNMEELACMGVLLRLNTEEKFGLNPHDIANLEYVRRHMNSTARFDILLAQQQYVLQYGSVSTTAGTSVGTAAGVQQTGIRNAPATIVSSQVPLSNVNSNVFMKDFQDMNRNAVYSLNSYREAYGANLPSQNNVVAAQNGNGDVAIKEDSCVIALRSGEKFLKWLEDWNHPEVTTVHLNHYKALLNSMRAIAAYRAKKLRGGT